ncbi:hypothetical protein JI742_00240 [Piscinibacter sp. Jin2]|uniref:Uncharacterized protein n=1 Tax=Aquariibacter lacus TaxID=2801332 RepID=A0A9X1BMM4_9BURK|nr:hypothetical protein [Piscinibacter lacus]
MHAQTGAASPNDYPTIDRVLFVQACLREHPGAPFEMINKCSCAVDALAREIRHEDYINLSTASNASTIGGERGSYLRDVESVQVEVRKYRATVRKAKEGCFIRFD